MENENCREKNLHSRRARGKEESALRVSMSFLSSVSWGKKKEKKRGKQVGEGGQSALRVSMSSLIAVD